jgi:diaminopimelate epimerase
MTPVAKAHGLGNDFLLVQERDRPPDASTWARRLCDRHRGLGADGVICYGVEEGGVRMQLWNADGGEAEVSGNGLRCLAAHVYRRGWLPARHEVRTKAGAKRVEVAPRGGSLYRVTTDLGPPILDSERIPIVVDPPQEVVLRHRLTVNGAGVTVTSTSMGNPHCALFFDEVVGDDVVTSLGAALERHPAFPRRTNVEFITVVAPDELRVRFWERGVGPTSASGTGAASAAVAAMLEGRIGRRTRVVCDGGVLEVEWPEGGSVVQVGEVELLYEGVWLGPDA